MGKPDPEEVMSTTLPAEVRGGFLLITNPVRWFFLKTSFVIYHCALCAATTKGLNLVKEHKLIMVRVVYVFGYGHTFVFVYE